MAPLCAKALIGFLWVGDGEKFERRLMLYCKYDIYESICKGWKMKPNGLWAFVGILDSINVPRNQL